jgi:TonB family protein
MPNFPKYPVDLRIQGIQGEVLVEVWVGPDGLPYKSEAIWGPPELRRAASRFCSAWKFNPYLVDNKPTKARFRIVNTFRLKQGRPYQIVPKEYTYQTVP